MRDQPYSSLQQQLNVALREAAAQGASSKVQALLAQGAEIDSQDAEGKTTVMYAAGNGHTDVVALLLQRGSNVWLTDNYGYLPLLHADRNDHIPAARLLGRAMRAEADPKWLKGALVQAADGHPAWIAGLLEAGAASEGLPLLMAIQCGEKEIVRMMIEAGVQLDSSEGEPSPLIHAIQHGYPSIVKLLVEAGADVHQRQKEGVSPLEFANYLATTHPKHPEYLEIVTLLRDATKEA